MTPVLLNTKIYIPSVHTKLVARPHLIERLNAGLNGKLILVSAPAGFGKTTCVTEWLDQLAYPVAWLSLDAADDDPALFFTYLIAALQQIDNILDTQFVEVNATLSAAGRYELGQHLLEERVRHRHHI